MNGLRRAFMWSGERTPSDAQCLVAWDMVTRPKIQDGLGIKDLGLQISCLLVKLIHRPAHSRQLVLGVMGPAACRYLLHDG
ncbi:hypothetical protein PR202_gb27204 [Eleusine coracana subsp. coracana]|uniref:Uncharacterized protein n=1 Tax=Eleusine coracana subsp. coracana TaxID=191504 RepID=A0AAV5FT85_ELECO|nr:hypothetical protein PR202_gb27204 [Eleusine coracana subsp. coracana]